MSTPTPEDLDRQAAEWAKDKCMYMNTATPETDAASFPTTYNGRHIEVVSGKVARKLERERDEARAALSTALREREAARQAIAMADGTLVQIVAERDAWKAKATRTCHIIHSTSRFGFDFHVYDCGGRTPVGVIPKFCPGCGGEIKQTNCDDQIVKEEEK